MKSWFCILLIVHCSLLFPQRQFVLNDFSKEYHAKVFVSDTSQVFSKGWIAIYETKGNREIIHVNLEELALTLHSGKPLSNIKELPYGEQSVVMYDDFNFDGIKDLAVEEGQNSCYHGPSFRIYLANGNGFKYSPEFSKLSQEYCGMFSIDQKKKTINAMTKSGCCWHVFSEFAVQNGVPVLIKETESNQTEMPYETITTTTYKGKVKSVATRKEIAVDSSESTVICTFKLENKDKEVMLFKYNNMLNYAFIQKDGNVEFSYPLRGLFTDSDFAIVVTEDSVSLNFTNENATYKIYEYKGGIGVEVESNGKTYKMPGDLKSKKGRLLDLTKFKFENITQN